MKKHSKKVKFEEWYVKILDAKHENMLTYTVHTGNALAPKEGDVEVIYDINGDSKRFSGLISQVNSSKESIRFDGSTISKNKMILEIKQNNLSLIGQLELKHVVDLKKSYWKPGLMGMYKHIPFLEFYQEVLVLHGESVGTLQLGEKEIDFTGGRCYIQKQWGTNFPNIWLWAQCDGFEKKKDLALMVGIARLKLIFNYYTAFAIPVYYNNHLEIFSNYNGGHIAKLYRYKGYIHLIVTQKDKLLDLKIYGRDEVECISSKETHGIRDVYEGNRVKLEIKISKQGNVLIEDSSLECNIEMGGNTSKLK